MLWAWDLEKSALRFVVLGKQAAMFLGSLGFVESACRVCQPTLYFPFVFERFGEGLHHKEEEDRCHVVGLLQADRVRNVMLLLSYLELDAHVGAHLQDCIRQGFWRPALL